jgi:hypothetical protein
MDKDEVKLPRWATREAKLCERRGEKFDMRMLGAAAQWPEDWRVYHQHGLECIVMSGRVDKALFIEPIGHDGERIRAMFPPRDPDALWIYFVMGRLLVGVGAEILLKGLYLKRGYSIRNPENPHKEPLVRLGAPEAQKFDPYNSASFGTLLRDHNLQLLGEPRPFKPLTVAKWWRDEAAHTAVTTAGEVGVYNARLALSLRMVHDELMRDADPDHAAAIGAILAERQPIGSGTTAC